LLEVEVVVVAVAVVGADVVVGAEVVVTVVTAAVPLAVLATAAY